MRDILFIMVAILYVVSTMGYGVHKCNAEGTASLILLFGETPCEYVHSHTDSNGNTYTHAHHPGNHSCSHGCTHHPDDQHHTDEHNHEDCCSTSVYVLTHDQNTNDSSQWDVPQPQLMAGLVWEDHMQQLWSLFPMQIQQETDDILSVAHSLGIQAELCIFRI